MIEDLTTAMLVSWVMLLLAYAAYHLQVLPYLKKVWLKHKLRKKDYHDPEDLIEDVREHGVYRGIPRSRRNFDVSFDEGCETEEVYVVKKAYLSSFVRAFDSGYEALKEKEELNERRTLSLYGVEKVVVDRSHFLYYRVENPVIQGKVTP